MASHNGDRPDIVWIYCDELRADALGCYGNRNFRPKTPHMDRLAESGVRFERCYCNSPVSVPSRMAVLTASYPEQNGVYGNEAHWKTCQYRPRPVMFPETFARAGYATANFGKIHLPQGLQPWGLCRREGATQAELRAGIEPESEVCAPGPGMVIAGRFRDGVTFPGERVTDNALNWMAHQDSPFLVRIGYLQPHTPVCPPAPFDALYQPETFPGSFPCRAGHSDFERRFGEICGAAQLPAAQLRQAQAAYYGLVAWIDGQVGRILDWLRDAGRADRTLVVLESDHGAVRGEFGACGKHVFAPMAHRIPRLIAWPGTLPRAAVRGDLCEGLDLARTLLGAAGLTAPPEFLGRDLFASDEPEAVYATIGYGMPWSRAFPNRAFGAYRDDRGWPRRACLRTARYRLDMTVRQDGQEILGADRDIFLADTLADPEETVNLVADPAHAGVRDHLVGLLETRARGAVEDACHFDISRLPVREDGNPGASSEG